MGAMLSSQPRKRSSRTILTPLAGIGTMTQECRPVRGASGRDTPTTITKAQAGCAAPVMYHLRPLITHSAPSRRRVAAMLVASDEATSGSVMPGQRTRPSSSGPSQRFFCSASRHAADDHAGTSGARLLNTREPTA
jgi:hypothetical protein